MSLDKKRTALQKQKSIVILGASFATGNLGVSALAWSSIKAIRCKWPGARIVLVGSGRQAGSVKARIGACQEEFTTWPVRYCSNILAQNHIVGLFLAVFLGRLNSFLKKYLATNRSTLGELLRCDLVCDISGGDSFSDIYGLSRFLRGYLLKRVCQMTEKPFILLPQTYGPFKTSLARNLACKILTNAKMIYSRDKEGVAVVENLIGVSDKLLLCPDVAFVLEAIRSNNNQTVHLEQMKTQGFRLIGLNISGLLYNGGYSRNNMFGLKCDYPSLVIAIIKHFSQQADTHVLLVPHVLTYSYAVEDDYVASLAVLESLPAETRERVTVLERGYDQNETKYFIGLCDFFLGARMHATIAALSQGVPSVGMAYSRKFAGVFATAGVENCVLDLRQLDNEQILSGIMAICFRRDELHADLEKAMPAMKSMISSMFNMRNII